MFSGTRTNQGGSVVSFLVVGVILTALTLGGVFFVQQRSGNEPVTQPTNSPAPSPAVQTASPSATPSVTPSSSPRPSVTPSPSPVPSSHPTTATAPAGDLPSTGPTDDLIMGALPIVLITVMLVSYSNSRRLHHHTTRR